MEIFTDVLKQAINDYYIMLTKGYPQKSVLKLVGDKFKLTGLQRSILYRGICKESEAAKRKVKIENDPNPDIPVYIDGYNVLLTIANYLSGRPVFICIDGVLRDSGEVHGKIRKSKRFTQSVEVLVNALRDINFTEVTMYLDQPISYSADLAMDITERFKALNITGNAKVLRYPDFHLKKVNHGSIASSDSVIMDKTPCKVFDMSRWILEQKYTKDFIFLDDFMR